MSQIISLVEKTTAVQIIDILIAVGIILFFRIFSSGMSYIIIKMFKFKEKKSKRIKESAFYNPLRIFFNLLGIYLAILFLKEPLNISETTMLIVTKIFKIVSVIVFAKGIAESFTEKSTLVKKIKEKTNKNLDDSMLSFMIKISRFIIYAIAVYIICNELGFNLNGVIAGLGIGRSYFNSICSRYS